VESVLVEVEQVSDNHINLFSKAIDEAQAELDRLTRAQEEAHARITALRQGLSVADQKAAQHPEDIAPPSPTVGTAAEKVRLFRERFRGRTDVFPVGGKTRDLANQAIRRLARTNGFGAYVASRRQGAQNVRIGRSYPIHSGES